MIRFFIAGTDTEVGKTLVSTALLAAARGRGLTTAALKPVAAGCDVTDDGLRNADALALGQVMSAPLSYQQVNPVALKAAIAPHIAASQEGQSLSVARLTTACLPVITAGYDWVLVEGAGGWRVPLNRNETLADLAIALELPVILVVGLRLGCINHALLTAEAIRRDGLPVLAWVANQLELDMPAVSENCDAIAQRLNAPCLGHIPFLHNPTADDAAGYLDIDKLLA